MQHLLDVAGLKPGGSDLDGDATRSEWFSFKAVFLQLVRNLSEHRLLRWVKFDDDRHQQALALNLLICPLSQYFFKQHALVRDMLIDNPQTFRIDGEDE